MNDLNNDTFWPFKNATKIADLITITIPLKKAQAIQPGLFFCISPFLKNHFGGKV
jgi:hypothetical protein